jgi:hypothetical protein
MTVLSNTFPSGVDQERGSRDAGTPAPGNKSAAGAEVKVETEDEAAQTAETREHLGVLCDVLRIYLQPQIQLQMGLTVDVPRVTFSDLWYIFKPGYEIRTSGSSQVQL